MNKLILAGIFSLVITGVSFAGHKWSNTKVDVDELQKEMIAAGCTGYARTRGMTGEIVGPDCAAAAAVLAAHDPMKKKNERAAMEARAEVLYAKAKARTLTLEDEQQEFMEIMFYLQMGK